MNRNDRRRERYQQTTMPDDRCYSGADSGCEYVTEILGQQSRCRSCPMTECLLVEGIPRRGVKYIPKAVGEAARRKALPMPFLTSLEGIDCRGENTQPLACNPTKCRCCGSQLIPLLWSRGKDLLVCDVTGCAEFAVYQGWAMKSKECK